jgi:hypothetical protein
MAGAHIRGKGVSARSSAGVLYLIYIGRPETASLAGRFRFRCAHEADDQTEAVATLHSCSARVTGASNARAAAEEG